MYILTEVGTLQRWDVAAQSLLPSFEQVAYDPSGFDISPDGRFAYVGEAFGDQQATIRKIDLNDGSHTNLYFDLRRRLEGGVFDIAITSNGKAFITATSHASGFGPLRELDLSTGEVTERRHIGYNTSISRSADHSLLFFQEDGSNYRGLFTYDAEFEILANSIDPKQDTGSLPDAVNHDGSLIAFQGDILNSWSLDEVASGITDAGGYIFDPDQDILYVANTLTDEIIVYTASDLTVLAQFPIGEDISGFTSMSITGSSGYLFITTPTGIREIELPAVSEPAQQSASLLLESEPTFLLAPESRPLATRVANDSSQPTSVNSSEADPTEELAARFFEDAFQAPSWKLWSTLDQASQNEIRSTETYLDDVDELLADPEEFLLVD